MKFWWVNHKQTFKEEFEGGYIWSPKTKSNGSRNQTYLNLTETAPGDRILSFASAQIKAIGIITEHYSDEPKPSEFGSKGENWDNTGWLVKVKWLPIEKPIRPKEHITSLREFLPDRHSPIQENGNGNQSCYLAAISQKLFERILKLCSFSNNELGNLLNSESIKIEGDIQEKSILNNRSINIVEKERLVKARYGQGLYKSSLIRIEKRCRITLTSNPDFLIASHIKPWSKCNDEEKLDGNNGLLLSPHIDKLFDKGWISFSDQGDLLISSELNPLLLKQWHLPIELNTGHFNQRQKEYLAFHRRHIFRHTQ